MTTASAVLDHLVRAGRRVQDVPALLRSIPARLDRAYRPQDWLEVHDASGVTPFWPQGDAGELVFEYGCHRSEGPVLIEGKTFYAQPHPLVRFRVLKLTHGAGNNADALLVLPRTSGCRERELGEEIELRWFVKRSAFAAESWELRI